jgi:hypothetical protein
MDQDDDKDDNDENDERPPLLREWNHASSASADPDADSDAHHASSSAAPPVAPAVVLNAYNSNGGVDGGVGLDDDVDIMNNVYASASAFPDDDDAVNPPWHLRLRPLLPLVELLLTTLLPLNFILWIDFKIIMPWCRMNLQSLSWLMEIWFPFIHNTRINNTNSWIGINNENCDSKIIARGEWEKGSRVWKNGFTRKSRVAAARAANNRKTQKRDDSSPFEDDTDTSSEEKEEGNEYLREESNRQADRALQTDIEDRVLSWVD